ncbi:hypothetical protein ACFO4N_07690 [Camelliibacillus cellulosilyticus]|uniref:Spore germination protein GerPC n=1 Tax=Camelliibacillus cellulosilyticus TaxID=2174486 RepID=A0ABV9GKT6_9BACL
MWFWKKNAQQNTLRRLEKKIEHLEDALQKIINQGFSYDITIEELNIHDPVLENLTFRFDELDVKEVSGALNLGTTFGVNVHQKEKKKSERSTQTRTDGPAVSIKKSPIAAQASTRQASSTAKSKKTIKSKKNPSTPTRNEKNKHESPRTIQININGKSLNAEKK